MLGFVFYFCILLTGSRGGLVFGAVEMLMCCALFILYDRRRRLTYISICVCIVFALLIFSSEFISFFGSTIDRLLSAINGVLIGEQQEVRYYQYMRGIGDFLEHPIFGTGIGYMGNRDVYAGRISPLRGTTAPPSRSQQASGSLALRRIRINLSGA